MLPGCVQAEADGLRASLAAEQRLVQELLGEKDAMQAMKEMIANQRTLLVSRVCMQGGRLLCWPGHMMVWYCIPALTSSHACCYGAVHAVPAGDWRGAGPQDGVGGAADGSGEGPPGKQDGQASPSQLGPATRPETQLAVWLEGHLHDIQAAAGRPGASKFARYLAAAWVGQLPGAAEYVPCRQHTWGQRGSACVGWP